jgi:hypothetical protein
MRNTLLIVLTTWAFQVSAQFRDFMTYGYWNDKTDKNNITLGLNMGLPTGIGVDIAYRFKQRLATRFSFNFADLTINDYRYTIGSANEKQAVAIDFKTRLSHFTGNFDIFLNKTGSFRLLSGFDFTLNNTFTVGGQLDDIIKFNDVSLNADDLGSGTITMGFKSKVAPLLGLGFGKLFPEKRLGFSADLGAHYRGNYTFDITVKEGVLLKKNEENEVVLARNFNRHWYQKIWPFLNIRLSYRLTKPKKEVVEYEEE